MEQLISLDEHNKHVSEIHRAKATYPRRNGIACPKCGEEMMDKDRSILTSHPPQRKIICSNPDCKHTTTRLT